MSAYPGFAALTDTDAKAKAVLEGSCVYSDIVTRRELLASWRESRSFITGALHRPGTILDYGCANGYLLRCLMEWSPHALTPFGVDVDDERLRQARSMFPGLEHHFLNNAKVAVAELWPHGFDYVYWAVGDNVDFAIPKYVRWLNKVARLTAPGGRLILAFYADSCVNAKKLKDLRRRGVRHQGLLRNGDRPELLGWVDM